MIAIWCCIQSHSASGTRRMGMDRQTPKVKLFKERPGRERSITPEQVITLLSELPLHQRDSSSSRWRPECGSRMSSVSNGHAWTSRILTRGSAPINRRIAIRFPCRSMQLRWSFASPARQAPRAGVHLCWQPLGWANTKAWREALKRAGIDNFRWHDLRHTWASWHRQSGTPTHELQRLGGWKSSVMVERYAHLAPDHLAKAAKRLDSVLDGYDLATVEKEKGVSEQR